jgi:hypothetical protein
MSRRRLTWLVHNALMMPFVPVRIGLFWVMKLGEAAEWIVDRMPGLRRYDGWEGW